MSINTTASSSSATQLLRDGLDYIWSLKDDLVASASGSLRLSAAASSKRAIKDVGHDVVHHATRSGGGSVGGGGSSLISSDYAQLLKKLVSLGIASAAVFGSAFYIGYHVARRRHRFHVREADKNDQVRKFIIKIFFKFDSVFSVSLVFLFFSKYLNQILSEKI